LIGDWSALRAVMVWEKPGGGRREDEYTAEINALINRDSRWDSLQVVLKHDAKIPWRR
jgi:hypothetical protein